LEEIRRIWRSEEQDWEDSVPKIYREVMGEDREWAADEGPVFSMEDRRLLDRISARNNVPSAMVAKLLDVEREHRGMSRRSSVHQRIAAVLEEDWRSDEEIAGRANRATS
jgi:DNA sulfur modification protein DndC